MSPMSRREARRQTMRSTWTSSGPDFLGVFPLVDPGHVRVIGSVPDASAAARGGLRFDDVRGQALGNLKLERSSRKTGSRHIGVHHRVAKEFPQGTRVFLLGDAAHVHSPVGAQGMNTGIGDAINLSWKIAAVMTGSAPENILESYALERMPFARRLVATTDRAFSLVTSRGRIATWFRTRCIPILLPRIFGFAGLRRRIFRILSQIGIEYRNSFLSVGSAGSVHGGDRLPWVVLAGGDDNYATLQGMAWRVHVYGAAPKGIEEACREMGLPLHVFPWRPELAGTGFEAGAVYLIRPDGYVALADGRCSPEPLREYFRDRLRRAA